jgi:hypothetical protein
MEEKVVENLLGRKLVLKQAGYIHSIKFKIQKISINSLE